MNKETKCSTETKNLGQAWIPKSPNNKKTKPTSTMIFSEPKTAFKKTIFFTYSARMKTFRTAMGTKNRKVDKGPI